MKTKLVPATICLLLLCGGNGCSPKLESENPKERLRAVLQLSSTNQAELTEVALHDKDSEVRCAAIGKLHDAILLRQLALSTNSFLVREAALRRVDDPLLLESVASNHAEESLLRLAAVNRIGDQAALARVAIAANNDFYRSAMEKLYSQEQLARVAIHGNMKGARVEAAKKLRDHPTLIRLALETSDSTTNAHEIVEIVVGRISEPAALARIATEAKHFVFRLEAVKKISDQTVLSAVARGDPISYVRTTAIQKIDDPNILLGIAAETRDGLVQGAIGERLSNTNVPIKMEILEKLALEEKNSSVRWAAVTRLTNQMKLAVVAGGDQVPNIWRAALERLDKTNLIEVVISRKHWSDPRAAVARVDDKDSLLRLATEAGDTYVRLAAYWKLYRQGDQTALNSLQAAFDLYGGRELAEACVNSAFPVLSDLGQKWARKNGYSIERSFSPRETGREFW